MPALGITARFGMLMATAAVLPLVAFGLISIGSLREGTRVSVLDGNARLATQAATRIDLYLTSNVRILRSAAADLVGTELLRWQQERILRNYVLSFPEYRHLVLIDGEGAIVASSELVPRARALPDRAMLDEAGVAFTAVDIDSDLLPTTGVAIRISDAGGEGWLLGELRLEHLWQLVDELRVGTRGFALLADERGRLIAHGDPDEKPRVARGESLAGHPIVGQVATSTRPAAIEYEAPGGGRRLAVAVPVATRGWTLIVEQPTEEAYALADRLERQLLVVILVALVVVIGLGAYWGRSLIQPIFALMRATTALAEGRMDARVHIDRRDEFRTLGEAFNGMADRLVALQDEGRRQERQATFGRIATGLVHDIAHPIRNIGNNCRLMYELYDDASARQTFRNVVERELATLKRFLDNLQNLARPIPLERFPVDVGRLLDEVTESMRALAEAAGLTLDYRMQDTPLVIEGDLFALGRVYRNLLLNAIQATAPGGRIEVRASRVGTRARVDVTDTGCGIARDRLASVFDDFSTTKRRGLGLGLAISRRVVEQLGGTIEVESEVGQGSTFRVEFETTDERPIGLAASTGHARE